MKLFTTLLLLGGMSLSAQAQSYYQIPNSDFEGWSEDGVLLTSDGSGWHSFETATGDYNAFAGWSPAPQQTEGFAGNGLMLTSLDLGLAKANGNLTTGLINMGSYNAADPSNYNFSDTGNASGSLLFAGRPDAVTFYAKFKSGGSPNGRVQLILHDDVQYRDPELEEQAGNKVGSAAVLVPETEEWTLFTGEFTYLKEAPEVQYMLASATTNPEPGGSAGDEFYIDELQLIYYHSLASLQFDGQEIAVGDATDFDFSSVLYDPAKLSYTVKGAGATVESNYDAQTALLTITVLGNDISVNPESKTTYRLQFQVPQAVTTDYTSDLSVAVNDVTTAPQSTTVQLTAETDGSTTFELKNFVFMEIPVGNIRLTNVTVDGDKYTFDNHIQITAGDDPRYPAEGWIGPALSQSGDGIPVKMDATVAEDKITALINIDMTETLGQSIKVVLADKVELTPETTLAAGESVKNYVFSRTFPAGWSTLCVPFSTSINAEVQQFTGSTADGPSFTKLPVGDTGATLLEANVPYLVRFDNETTVTAYYGGAVNATPATVTRGTVSFCGNYTAGLSLDGLYTVTDPTNVQVLAPAGADAELGSTSAYFRTTDGTTPETLYIQVEGGKPTAIGQATQTLSADGPAYNLQGVKVADSAKNLPAGLYIVNGRKVIVK